VGKRKYISAILDLSIIVESICFNDVHVAKKLAASVEPEYSLQYSEKFVIGP
jgi:hypothetical protein